MSSLTGSINFSVAFDFTGTTPALVLTPSTTIPLIDQPNLIGHFTVTQPDGLPLVGTYGEVAWNGTGYNSITVPLTLASDYTYQRGDYIITFFAACTGYTYGEITRTWDMEYLKVDQTFTDGFDCFTPSLTYTDSTNYGVGGYSITGVTSAWSATSAAGNPTGTSSVFDLVINGNYYDSTYKITYVKTINYLNAAYSWLTVNEKITYTVTKKANIPPSMATMLTYLINIKDQRDAALTNCQTYDDLDELFEDANSLYQFIRTRVCAQNTIGLQTSFDQFYALTHNQQPRTYINTNATIPAYDFAAGCSGTASSGIFYYKLRAVVGENSFTVAALDGKTITAVVRSGLGKAITTSATTDSEYLQIVGNVVTLPTGDVVAPVMLPDGSIVGELFIYTYQ